jgi:hypothetical protein
VLMSKKGEARWIKACLETLFMVFEQYPFVVQSGKCCICKYCDYVDVRLVNDFLTGIIWSISMDCMKIPGEQEILVEKLYDDALPRIFEA